MKKQLLIASVALASLAPIASAQDPGDRDKVNYSSNLSLEWYGVPTGAAADPNTGRTGIGVNGKFFVALKQQGVAIFNKDGQIKMIDNKDAWVSINCDDAGNVYFRSDKGGFPGPAGAGWYVAADARISIIDSKTNEVIKNNIPFTNNTSTCRFDALPHIYGNMVEEFFELWAPNNGAGSRVSGFFFGAGAEISPTGDSFLLTNLLKQFPSPANATQTLGSTQIYGDGTKMAILANNHIDVTCSAKGWGNNITVAEYDDWEEEWVLTDKWFNTPNHSAIGGFCMFEYNGENYIVYPSGTTAEGFPSGDGFFVMKEELVDSPQNLTAAEDAEAWKAELKKAVATKYATEGIASGQNYRGINVEPVEGEDGKFRIYFFDPGKSMQVWILDLTGSAGINDIVADKDAAKVYGGYGVVVVDGAEKAQVYTTAGQLVAEGNGSIAVPAGLYIVKAGKTAAKVIVK